MIGGQLQYRLTQKGLALGESLSAMMDDMIKEDE
jgi:hypothetical protein